MPRGNELGGIRLGGRQIPAFFRELLALAVPFGIALALIAQEGSLSAENGGEGGEGDKPEIPPLCGAWHRGGGDVREIDLERMKAGYKAFKENLAKTLERSVIRKFDPVAGGMGSGFPACTGNGVRNLARPGGLPPGLQGRRLWFFAVSEDDPTRVRLPREIEEDRDALLFVLRVRRLADLDLLAKALGREIAVAPRKFAEALGVRCAGTLVRISKEGGIEIHENP